MNDWLSGINVCQQKLKGKNNEQTKPWEVKLRETSLTSFIKVFGRDRVHLASLQVEKQASLWVSPPLLA